MKVTFLSIGLMLLSTLSSGSVQAADTFVLPQGAGTKSGASWENALDASAGGLQKGWDAIAPGETCFVGGGEYKGVTLSVGGGGTEARYKKLVGVNRGGERPRLVGTWTKEMPAKGPDCITLKQGASFWSLENLDIRSYRNAVITSGGRHTGIRLLNIDVTGARAGMELAGGGLAAQPEIGTHDVVIQDCDFVNFTKRGIRFQGGNYKVRVVNCLADAGGKVWATEPFQMGFSVQGSQTSDKKATEASADHDITFVNCTANNSYNDAGAGYWNADGFVAESTPYNLRYENCKALDNTDGGWDDKSRNPVLINCVALRNKRNFRFWTTKGTATLTNCIGAFAVKRGGNSTGAGLWSKGNVRAENCTFHDNTINVDLDEPTARVELVRCIISSSKAKRGTPSTVEAGGQLTLTDTAVWEEGKNGDDPQFASTAWDGTGNGMDSRRYGKAKGYHSGFSASAGRVGARN
ncbi:MAG: hypothetical protein V4671_23125 [Armatimonadota bacterium]